MNQITFTYGERKKELPNFYGMFRQSLSISAAFTAILKMKLPQYNAIGVRTPPDHQQTVIDLATRACYLVTKHLSGSHLL